MPLGEFPIVRIQWAAKIAFDPWCEKQSTVHEIISSVDLFTLKLTTASMIDEEALQAVAKGGMMESYGRMMVDQSLESIGADLPFQ